MAPLADFILAYVPLPELPHHLRLYVNGKTPMSTPQEVFPALAAYLVIIFSTQAFMKDRAPMKLQHLFQAHNIFLCSGSLLLMTLILEAVIPMVWQHGVWWGMCNISMWSDVSPLTRRLHTRTRVAHRDSRCVAPRVLLHGQLLLQVPRAFGHCIPCFEEEAAWYVNHPGLRAETDRSGQLSFMCSTTLRPLCCAILSLMAGPAWLVTVHFTSIYAH